MRKDAPGPASGFTLVELSITLVVAAVLLALGLPAFQELQERSQVQATLHLLTSQLALARMAAVTRNSPVVVCPSAGTGTNECLGGTDWSTGWLTFIDPDGNRHPDRYEDVLRDDPALRGRHGITIQSTSGRSHLRYHPDGSSPGTNLTLRLCRDGWLLGSVVVSNVGRSRTHRPSSPAPCPD